MGKILGGGAPPVKGRFPGGSVHSPVDWERSPLKFPAGRPDKEKIFGGSNNSPVEQALVESMDSLESKESMDSMEWNPWNP